MPKGRMDISGPGLLPKEWQEPNSKEEGKLFAVASRFFVPPLVKFWLPIRMA